MISENPKIELCDINGSEFLRFTFRDKFLKDHAKNATQEWDEIFESTHGEKVPIIWDCINMTGYDHKARILWQKEIKKLKKQIDCVWLITDSKIIKAGAKTMSLFTSFKINVIESENQINI